MTEPLDRAHELFSQFEAELQAELPVGADIFDAHTHLGNDIDGMVGHYEELEKTMDRFGISRCFFFCLDEPDRHRASAPPTTARSSSVHAQTAG